MRDRPAADRTAKLLLWFQREPLRYRAEVRRRDRPPLDSEVVLKLALGRPVELADPMLSRLSSAAWREAAATYVRQVFFRPHATPYQTLGLAPGASAQAIKENFRLLMQLVHPDRQDARSLWPESFAAQANRAYGILRNDQSRADLDRDEYERAARARTKQHKAALAAMAPTPRWPPVAIANRRTPSRARLPEWLTAVVGGFMRQHPAVVAFVVLLGAAALVIGAVMWKSDVGSLTREARAPSVPTRPAPERIVAEPVMTAVEPDAPVAPQAGDGGRHVSLATPLLAVDSDTMPTARSVFRARPAAVREPQVDAVDVAETRRTSATPSAEAPPDRAATAAGAAADLAATKSASANSATTPADPPSAPTAASTPATSTLQPLTMAEIDALFAAFVDSYDRGRLDTFAVLFDEDAETNLYHGRAAIRGEYGELFRLSEWRQMQLQQISWRRDGERAYAKGEIAVRIAWRDGREVKQRVAVDIEVARRGGRVVITRLAHQSSAP